MKLTIAQRALLSAISVASVYCAPYYPPARRLVELGLAEWLKNRVHITEAGKVELMRGGKP